MTAQRVSTQWLTALGLEIEAAGRETAGATPGATQLYRAGVRQLGGTAAGGVLAEWVRTAGGVDTRQPVLVGRAAEVIARHGVRGLSAAVRALPVTSRDAAVVAIQLAESIDAVHRDRLALLSIDLVTERLDTAGSAPLDTAGSAPFDTAAALGAADLTAGERSRRELIRRACRIAGRAGVVVTGNTGLDPAFDDLHTLARGFLAADHPRRSLRFAYRAAGVARGRATARTDLTGSHRLGSILRSRALRGGDGRAAGPQTYATLTEQEAWRRRCGAALVSAARAHLRLGEAEHAVRVARVALALGNTLGNLPLAAAVASTGASVAARGRLLDGIEEIDRLEYRGVESRAAELRSDGSGGVDATGSRPSPRRR